MLFITDKKLIKRLQEQDYRITLKKAERITSPCQNAARNINANFEECARRHFGKAWTIDEILGYLLTDL